MCDNRLSTRKHEYFPIEKLAGICQQIKAIGATSRACPTAVDNNGEAVYHPEFEAGVKIVAQYLYWTFGSNCDAMTPEKSIVVLDNKPTLVSLSLDAVKPETLKSIRPGVRFERAVEHAEAFIAEVRKRPPWDRSFYLQFVVMKQNAHELSAWVDRWLPLIEGVPGFMLHVKPVFVWPRISDIDAASFYPAPPVPQFHHPQIQRSPQWTEVRRTCRLLWDFAWIMSDGAYSPCCMCADDVWGVGNVFEKSLVELYNSAKLNHYRELIAAQRFSELPLCDRCK